ncbi:hypothetical protein SDRG_15224 [Saprolegnia diclina VS20]|uniref:Uncharacterized protein n=1 Tax=Saprolegnia diclina (strain VS20) TaxID=1156394 RepID=T0Q0Y9_SAPDV|nr:hypothetical protein SDRG_15224 [Saprolegnia diclina VS20]EQC27010.1 hypothetical protein SDRG_15224 [Saprolegnia diclina VS20]|eukprot:XP_008619612.1 hypothetical protein SDRG_15224 [Saprolegnia diclina VS20]
MAEEAAALALDLSDTPLSLNPTASSTPNHGETGDGDYLEAHVRDPNAPAAMDLRFSFHFEEKASGLEAPIDAEKVLQLQWSSSDALPQEDAGADEGPTIESAAVLKYKQSQPIVCTASEAPEPTEHLHESTLQVDPSPESIMVAEQAPASEFTPMPVFTPAPESTSTSELSLIPKHTPTSDPTAASECMEPPSLELTPAHESAPDLEACTPRSEATVHATLEALVLDEADTADAKMDASERPVDEKNADLADAKSAATNGDAESDAKAKHEKSPAPAAKEAVENHPSINTELDADAKTATSDFPVPEADEKPLTSKQPVPEADAKVESAKRTDDKCDAKTTKYVQPRAASAAETYSVANLYPVKWDDPTAAVAPSLRRASTKPAPTSAKGLSASMPVAKKRITSANTPTSSTLAQLRQSQLQHATEVARLKTLLDCVTQERDLALARAQRTHETLQAKADSQEQLHLQAATAVAERDALQVHCKTLQEAIRKEQVAAEDARKRAAAYQSDVHQLKAKWSVCQGQVAALEAEKTALAAAAETSKHEVYRTQAAHEKAMTRIAKLQKEVSLASTTHASERASWKRKIETLSADAKATAARLQHEAASDMQLKLQSATMLGEKARREKDEATETLHRRTQVLEAKLETENDRVRVLEAQLKAAAISSKKHAAALDLQSANKRLETELHALRRFVALQQKQAPSRAATPAAPPRRDLVMMMPPAPIRIGTVDTAVQATSEEPSESESAQVTELQAALARLEDVVAGKTEQLTSLRALHAQELQVQARAFLARLGSTS